MAAHAGGLDEFWQSDQASASSRSQASASEALGDFRSADLLDHSAHCMTKRQLREPLGERTVYQRRLALASSRSCLKMPSQRVEQKRR